MEGRKGGRNGGGGEARREEERQERREGVRKDEGRNGRVRKGGRKGERG